MCRRAYDVAETTRGVKVFLNDKKLPDFTNHCQQNVPIIMITKMSRGLLRFKSCIDGCSTYSLLNMTNLCNFSNSATSSNELPEEIPPTKDEIARIAEKIPIEKRSLTRGLTINKFEKDFIIYPEYQQTKEIDRIRKYIGKLGPQLQKALEESENAPLGIMPPKVREVLMNNGLFAAAVLKDHGGMGITQKDMLQIAECFGAHDLSLFTSYNHLLMASNLIAQFGTIEQRERFLPGIASGNLRPCICWRDDTTGVTPLVQVLSPQGEQLQRLCATKVDVVDALDANLFIVFANKKMATETVPVCYLIEKDAIQDSAASIKITDLVKTSGLRRCNFTTVVFDVPVDEYQMLGHMGSTQNMLEELSFASKTLYGAAVVGFLKKLLGDLCTFANQEVKGNLRLSDSHPIQKIIFELGVYTYLIESMVYYLGGLTDEELFLMQDIENSILQRFANRAMRHAIHAITEVAGLCATDMELPYDQMLKDSIAVMALSDPDLHLVRRITIPAIENYVNHFGGMKKFMKTTTFKKFLAGRGDLEDYMHPKLVHYITEHVHPSLMQGAKQFEHCLSRLEKVLDVLITQTGIHINTEYILLQDICTMIENNLAMIASLARASRSYAIGLRNSDLEVQWTIFFCTIAAEQSKKIAHDVMLKENEMVRITPRLTAGAKDMLQHNGYCLESPVERNW